MAFLRFVIFVLLVAAASPLEARGGRRRNPWDPIIRWPMDRRVTEENGTRWAVLVAGSNGFGNYRHQAARRRTVDIKLWGSFFYSNESINSIIQSLHQCNPVQSIAVNEKALLPKKADVCHAYQILKRGGLKDENIIVFMYDDIAMNDLNPRKGIIINHPTGEDVYAGVPKDYTGEQVTSENFYAVILGDKSAVKGGSGKVVNSKPSDRIFIYYSDHGGPGVLGMPNMPYLYAKDFIDVLKKNHASGTYKEMVIYVEACESGSVFQGLMPDDLNIYVMTASNAEESSWGTYCPGMDPSPPPEYITCLGDLYSVAWMEDSESHNLQRETIEQQYQQAKERTSNYNTYNAGSHVMEYGNKSIKSEELYLYQGFDPATENLTLNRIINSKDHMDVVNQRDADLLFLWERYKKLDHSGEKKSELLKLITDTILHRKHLDDSIDIIGLVLFGPEKGPSVLKSVRGHDLPLADDWVCLKSMVRLFEAHCGSLTQYGMKHMRAFANICNSGGVSLVEMVEACLEACGAHNLAQWSPLNGGYSA